MEARLKILELIYKAQTSHIGSNFSVVEILESIFKRIDFKKDKIILSAGWKACALYYFLWKKKKITERQLNSYCQKDSPFIGLTEPIIPEIPFAGGSMGMGLPAAVGMALAKKVKGEEGTVYCVMSDGELDCGTTWESALIAAQQGLDNLIVIVDNNHFQAMGYKDDILGMGIIESKFMEFGWDANSCDGHDVLELGKLLDLEGEGPYALIADTTKGKGVSFMEDDNLWHYKAPTEKEYKLAKEELEEQLLPKYVKDR
jgi:transketolase